MEQLTEIDALALENIEKTKTLVRSTLKQSYYGSNFANGNNSFRADNGVRIASQGSFPSWDRKSNTLYLPDALYSKSKKSVLSVSKDNFKKISYAVSSYSSWMKATRFKSASSITDSDLAECDKILGRGEEVSPLCKEIECKEIVASYLNDVIAEKNGIILVKQLEVEKITSEISSLREEVKVLEETSNNVVPKSLQDDGTTLLDIRMGEEDYDPEQEEISKIWYPSK